MPLHQYGTLEFAHKTPLFALPSGIGTCS
uniref:DNA-directed RNA polymerase I subunit, putative n=1 Tax=Arundo donax TaxID=35708 RepID=A0A0A9GEV4_ARUDO